MIPNIFLLEYTVRLITIKRRRNGWYSQQRLCLRTMSNSHILLNFCDVLNFWKILNLFLKFILVYFFYVQSRYVFDNICLNLFLLPSRYIYATKFCLYTLLLFVDCSEYYSKRDCKIWQKSKRKKEKQTDRSKQCIQIYCYSKDLNFTEFTTIMIELKKYNN